MIKITVSEADKPSEPLLKLRDMFDSPYGTIYQQYAAGKPTKDFWISCGPCEKALINFWFDDEVGFHKLSTNREKDLKMFASHVKVKRVDGDLKLKLKFEK